GTRMERVGAAEGDSVERAVAEAKRELQVRLAHDPLALDMELVDEGRWRESLAPDARLDRIEQREVQVRRGEWTVVQQRLVEGMVVREFEDGLAQGRGEGGKVGGGEAQARGHRVPAVAGHHPGMAIGDRLEGIAQV